MKVFDLMEEGNQTAIWSEQVTDARNTFVAQFENGKWIDSWELHTPTSR